MFASFTDNYKLCDLLWQPFNMPEVTAEKALVAAAKDALKASDAWTAADNEKLTAWLVEQLRLKGALEPPAKPAEDEKKGAWINRSCHCGVHGWCVCFVGWPTTGPIRPRPSPD